MPRAWGTWCALEEKTVGCARWPPRRALEMLSTKSMGKNVTWGADQVPFLSSTAAVLDMGIGEVQLEEAHAARHVHPVRPRVEARAADDDLPAAAWAKICSS